MEKEGEEGRGVELLPRLLLSEHLPSSTSHKWMAHTSLLPGGSRLRKGGGTGATTCGREEKSIYTGHFSSLAHIFISFFSFFFFWLGSMACEILVPRPGIEPASPALEEQSLNCQGSPWAHLFN